MTLEEQIARSKAISQHILHISFVLGLWFVVEYFFLVLSTRSILMAALRTPMMIVTPIVLCILLYKLRNKFFENDMFGRFRCWVYGVQIMFYAGLIEAFFIVVYNQWIAPNNLVEMHNAMIAQYENVSNMYTQTPGAEQLMPGISKTLDESIKLLKESEIEKPFQAGITMLSNDIFYGSFWSLIFCFFLHQKSKEENQTV